MLYLTDILSFHLAFKSNLPIVEVLQSSCGRNGLVDLVCLISGASPTDINITWLQDEKAISVVPSNNMDSQGKFISSKLSVSQADWNARIVYTCKVNHLASSTTIKQNMTKCKGKKNMSCCRHMHNKCSY